jgi:hypothetical protein
MTELPDLPSDLLELALNDLIRTEQDTNDVVDMTVWVKRIDTKEMGWIAASQQYPATEVERLRKGLAEESEPCLVCLAGAVIRRTIAPTLPEGLVLVYEHVDRSAFGRPIRRKLEAIDLFRTGYVKVALRHLNWDFPKGVESFYPVTQYGMDPKAFKDDLRALVQILRQAGV